MYFPEAYSKRPQFTKAISEVVRELSPDVVRINFDIGPDFDGDLALHLRVVLSNEVAKESRFSEVAHQVMSLTYDNIDLPNHGLFPHFHFRSEAEQAQMNDPAWA
jgi:hypothetical protein